MLRLVFMGTPDFSVPPLRALVAAGHDVALVVTRPDRPKGRGRLLEASPVKQAALELGLEVFQPEKPNREDSVERIAQARPGALIVVAFGAILKEKLLGMAPHGAINVHASLLPKYRGMSPIQRAIWAGDTVTGVTTMHMDQGVDTGDVILAEPVPIGPDETAGELHDRLSEAGARLLVETLRRIESGDAPRVPQSGEASYAPRLEKEHGFIDWSLPAPVVHNRIRALTPWPGATAFHLGTPVLVIRTRVANVGSPGTDRPVEKNTPGQSVPGAPVSSEGATGSARADRPGVVLSGWDAGAGSPTGRSATADPGNSPTGWTAPADPGTIVGVQGEVLRVACGTGAIDLVEVRPAGRATMTGAAFARGRRLEPGRDRFDSKVGSAT